MLCPTVAKTRIGTLNREGHEEQYLDFMNQMTS